MLDRLEALEDEFDEVERRLSDPEVFADQTKYRDLARRHKELEAIVERSRALRRHTADSTGRSSAAPTSEGSATSAARSHRSGTASTRRAPGRWAARSSAALGTSSRSTPVEHTTTTGRPARR